MILYKHERNYGCRILEVIFKGFKTLFLENEKIRVGILVEKGTDIFEFLYKPNDVDFMWRSYIGIKEKDFLPVIYNKNGNFLDLYHGGWQELFPNAGDAVEYKGAYLPQHGEVHSIPWSYNVIKNEPEEIIIKLFTRTNLTYFYIEKIITIKSMISALFIYETIINESREEMDFMWGHHPAFGPPFLSEDCVIDMPKCKILTDEVNLSPTTGRLAIGKRTDWPFTIGRNGQKIDLSKIPSVDANSHDRAYIYDLEEGWYALTNTKLRTGFGLAFDKNIFKYLWFWQVYGGAVGYPWYQKTYNIAIEPNSSYPPNLIDCINKRTSLKLLPGESIKSAITAVAFDVSPKVDNQRVKKVSLNGDILF